jgi:hypothetical protein
MRLADGWPDGESDSGAAAVVRDLHEVIDRLSELVEEIDAEVPNRVLIQLLAAGSRALVERMRREHSLPASHFQAVH